MSEKNLVRITFERESKFEDIKIEYGEVYYRDLTDEEKEELKTLEDHLKNFEDFSTAEKLKNEQHKAVIEKKRRFEELQQLPTTPQLEWRKVPLPRSVFFLGRPNNLVSFVEGIPQFMLDKIFKDEQVVNININSASIPISKTKKVEEEIKPEPLKQQIIDILEELDLTEDWQEIIEIFVDKAKREDFEGEKVYWVKPKGFLQEDWGPINRALKKAFGDCWYSEGKGYKDAHWEVPA